MGPTNNSETTGLLSRNNGSSEYGSSPKGSRRTPSTSAMASPPRSKMPNFAGNIGDGAGAGSPATQTSQGLEHYVYCLIYATVNVIISAPCLYGYAAVIFNNPVFESHMNALSKLVIFSSFVHQLGFTLFSTLDFAIGTVQDAGLIFLSAMANIIANQMVEDGHSEEEIVSTTLVLLAMGTAILGSVLIVMGKFGLADAVSYLPMPVVGGYLAFIGYFCFQAGVGLCISEPMLDFTDWAYLFNGRYLMLAVPGIFTGLVLTLTSRLATNSTVLPAVMVSVPAAFYLILFATGTSLDDVRDDGWVGPVSPSVPVSDLFGLVNFSQVRWDLLADLVPTWVGMVFVVSFASCLDVAAISIDMGEALDTNKELTTVGICNLMSGLTFGFTGSYIFSQTIFTYRTGVHSRFIGVLILSAFLYIVVSKVNVLEVSPLFFLGSTLIFIGYDLMYEWLWEVRHQVFLAEYGIVWLTFFAIHVVGIDMGIVVGVLFAVVGQIVTTAQNSDVNRIVKRSRAVWTPSDAKILHDHAYNVMAPKIVTLEVVGTVFFGSALNMLNRVVDEIGLQQDEKVVGSPVMTPHTSSSILRVDKRPSTVLGKSSNDLKYPPKYLVLDLMLMGHLDASAARGCFLQLVRMCSKRGICVCASGATPKNEWMFRSHEVSIQDLREEESTKAQLLSRKNFSKQAPEKILLFVTVQEALEFCEKSLIRSMNMPSGELKSFSRIAGPEDQPIGHVISHIIGASAQEKGILERLVDERYHDEISYRPGQQIFAKDTWADSFYIVLRGCVVSPISSSRAIARQREQIVSGAGPVHQDRVASVSELFDQGFIDANSSNVSTMWQAGGVLGYMDFLLERPRFFQAIATQADTKVAKFSQSGMNLLQTEDPELYSLIQRLLLCASTTDLSNCTCRDV